jgi:hypothetical protein
MLRLISILLLLGGMAAAAIGGAAVMESYRPHAVMDVATDSAPEPMDDMMDAAPDEAVMDAAPEEDIAMESPPPVPEGRSMTTRSLTADGSDDDMAAVASVEDTFDTAAMMSDEVMEGFGAATDAIAESAGVAAPAPEPKKSRAEAFMETLQTVPVAHETPTSAEYKRAFDVTLAIDATGDDTAADALPGRGNIVTGEAKVSDRVEARVSGANFEIVDLSPSVQSLSPLTENVWRWSVMPLSAGDHDLVFEIYAIDQDSVVPLRTFRDTVTVRVSGLNRAIAFADQSNPLFVLLGGLGSAVAGLLGAVKFFGRR